MGPHQTLPVYVLAGLNQSFSHGWWDAYPPLHYYVLAASGAPVLFAWTRGHLADQGTVAPPPSHHLSAGVGRRGRGHGRRDLSRGLARLRTTGGFVSAGAIVALVAPFVYYAKIANMDVPYTAWFGAVARLLCSTAGRGASA